MSDHNLFTFIRLIRTINRDVRKQWNFYLSSPQIQLLESLNVEGPKKMSDLANELGITVGAMTALADRMHKAGIISRERSSSDRRVIHLVITEKGKELVGDISRARSSTLEKYFGKLTEEETTLMLDLCNKMLK